MSEGLMSEARFGATVLASAPEAVPEPSQAPVLQPEPTPEPKPPVTAQVRRFWKTAVAGAGMVAAVAFAAIIYMVDNSPSHMIIAAFLMAIFAGAVLVAVRATAANTAPAPERNEEQA